jgi:prevent-host-death family protein
MVYTGQVILMKHVGIKQARQELPNLVDRAEAGEEIVITRQGKAVAKLVPAPKPVKALPSLTEFRQGIGRAGTPAVQLLREERDGR